MNPAYVLAGLLIAFVLVRMWDDTDDIPFGDPPADGPTPGDGAPEGAERVLLRVGTVVAALVAGFLLYIAPQIVLDEVWPDRSTQEARICIPWSLPVLDSPGGHANREEALLVERLSARGFADCPP